MVRFTTPLDHERDSGERERETCTCVHLWEVGIEIGTAKIVFKLGGGRCSSTGDAFSAKIVPSDLNISEYIRRSLTEVLLYILTKFTTSDLYKKNVIAWKIFFSLNLWFLAIFIPRLNLGNYSLIVNMKKIEYFIAGDFYTLSHP
jgi:hypothetical protein